MSTLKKRIKSLSTRFRSAREIKFTHDVPKWAVVQGIIARGDRRVAEMIFRAASKNESWRSIMKNSCINPGYFIHKKKRASEPAPWDHLRVSQNRSIS